jgi:hypothetical protein
MLKSLEKTKLNEIIEEKVSLIEQLSEENKDTERCTRIMIIKLNNK